MQSRRDVQRKQNRMNGLRVFKRVLLTLLAILLILWISYLIANHPRSAARRQAISMAEKYGHLSSPNSFYVFNREKTYYTVGGKNRQGKQILVIIPQKGGNISIIKQSSGITNQQAINLVKTKNNPRKILRTAPGIFNNKVVWEVTYINKKGSLCYDLINFKTGKFVQQIDNL